MRLPIQITSSLSSKGDKIRSDKKEASQKENYIAATERIEVTKSQAKR